MLFVCVKNGGKSQMAAALLRDTVGDAVEVTSAGTRVGEALNALSVESLAEAGIDMSHERPRQLTEDMVRSADLVITLGSEAQVTQVTGTRFENWEIDEPTARGIEGLERMRLVRDDIATKVADLDGRIRPPGATGGAGPST